MVRSRAALTVGLLVILAAFAYGTEASTATSVAGSRIDCGPAISASWLVAGTPDATSDAGLSTTEGERRHAAACNPVVQRARAGVLAAMAAGTLLALVGWSAHREPRGSGPRRVGRPAVDGGSGAGQADRHDLDQLGGQPVLHARLDRHPA